MAREVQYKWLGESDGCLGERDKWLGERDGWLSCYSTRLSRQALVGSNPDISKNILAT